MASRNRRGGRSLSPHLSPVVRVRPGSQMGKLARDIVKQHFRSNALTRLFSRETGAVALIEACIDNGYRFTPDAWQILKRTWYMENGIFGRVIKLRSKHF